MSSRDFRQEGQRRVARSYRRARALEAAHLRLLQDHYALGAAIVRARGQRAQR